ncbi:MAG: transposase [Methanobrevibacter sp.]|nr:transposase [Candidatus Methanovirga basalitermitum]
MKLSTRKWTCPDCDTKHDRDMNKHSNHRDYEDCL